MGRRGKSGGRKRLAALLDASARLALPMLLAGLICFPAFVVRGAVDRTRDAQAALVLSTSALGLQTELPTGNRRAEVRSLPAPSVRLSESTARVLLGGAVAVALVVIAFHVGSNLWSFSRSRRLESEDADGQAPAVAARMDQAQARADELADGADYAEAMHVLLLQSVAELRRRLRASIAASLTSREILGSLDLPPGGRESFADIIGRVEISYFGGREPGREEYLACRRSFEALTASLRRGTA